MDTVGFAFDVGPDPDMQGATVNVLEYGTPTERYQVRRQLPRGGFLSVSAGRAWAEASLPKRASWDDLDGPRNVEGVSAGQAVELMRELYREASEYVEPVQDGRVFDRSKIVRLDPVRDFDGIAHVGELLDGLANVPREARQKVRRFSDAERNRAETIRVGPKAWGSTLYDKHVETKGEAPEGRLRYEGRFHHEQLTSAWATDIGAVVRTVVNVTEEKVRALTRASFERVGFDREVKGKASVAEAVFGCDWLSRRQQAELWAFLTAPGAAERMSRHARARYRDYASTLGVTMAAAEDEAAEVVVRLDFDRGTEVFRVA